MTLQTCICEVKHGKNTVFRNDFHWYFKSRGVPWPIIYYSLYALARCECFRYDQSFSKNSKYVIIDGKVLIRCALTMKWIFP